MLKLPNYGMINVMPFQKGNKLHLKANRNTGENHPLFGKHHSENTRIKISQATLGQTLSEETRRKMSLSLPRGENHPRWKGGISSENALRRQSIDYKLWRKSVFERDDYTCVWCGARNGNGKTVILNADHIKPWFKFPELRFELSNGRTLCRPCHVTTFKDLWKN